MDLYDLAGVVGAAFVLFGLYRTASGKWKQQSLWYELDHLIGSSLLIIYLAHSRAYIGIIINVAYVIAAFVGLESYAERRKLIRPVRAGGRPKNRRR